MKIGNKRHTVNNKDDVLPNKLITKSLFLSLYTIDLLNENNKNDVRKIFFASKIDTS